jgi:CopG family nickel-responsive transcriptional regulator
LRSAPGAAPSAMLQAVPQPESSNMQRVTISIDDDLAEMFDRFVKKQGYENRSEAVRDLVRKALGEEQLEKGKAKHCVATLSYVYDHHERQLASRLTGMQHDHHDVTVATMHAHLDHENCLETVILRGPTLTVAEFARDVMAQTGVRHGNFHPIPMELSRPGPAGHVHHRPLS